jgi:hypothetical protein
MMTEQPAQVQMRALQAAAAAQRHFGASSCNAQVAHNLILHHNMYTYLQMQLLRGATRHNKYHCVTENAAAEQQRNYCVSSIYYYLSGDTVTTYPAFFSAAIMCPAAS